MLNFGFKIASQQFFPNLNFFYQLKFFPYFVISLIVNDVVKTTKKEKTKQNKNKNKNKKHLLF